MLDKIDTEEIEKIKEKLEWEYKYKTENSILTKSSVTKIKNMKLDLEEEENIISYNTPEFLQGEKKITASEKGTLIHLVLQNLKEKVDYTHEKLDNLLQTMQDKNIITEKERQAIEIDRIYEFTKSKIWEDMKNVKEIQRERPFYINIKARELYEEETEEEILVQGIIDLYYITDSNKLILVDYKTDKVKTEEELVEKYKIQLEIYKEALEKALNRTVDKIYIYSVHLSKEIEI